MEEREYISRMEHEEFRKRIEDEEDRQNHRLDRLEDTFEKISDLTISVHELALSVKAMQEEQSRQGQRLEVIEREPADKWNKAVWTVITVVLTALATFILSRIIGG